MAERAVVETEYKTLSRWMGDRLGIPGTVAVDILPRPQSNDVMTESNGRYDESGD